VREAVRAQGFLERVRESGEYLMSGLRELSARLGLGELRGRGLLVAFELGGEIGPRVVELAREAGVLVNSARVGGVEVDAGDECRARGG
jgi:acetylornithine/N-succinyldiaminopimelate aminotransferase